MNTNLTEGEIKDITEREQKALDFLKELQLTPAVMMQAVNLGNDTFGMKPLPYLQDTKFSTPSPIPTAAL